MDSKSKTSKIPRCKKIEADNRNRNSSPGKNDRTKVACLHSDVSTQIRSESIEIISTAEEAVALIRRLQEATSPRGLRAKEQIEILRSCEQELQKHLIRVSAEAEATQKVVDVLVDNAEELRQDREAMQLVCHATMNAVEEMQSHSDYMIISAKAQGLVWKGLATAMLEMDCMQSPKTSTLFCIGQPHCNLESSTGSLVSKEFHHDA